MMKEAEHDDHEVVSLLETDRDGKDKMGQDIGGCVRQQYIATKLFYFLFFAAQGSLMPYLALYYKQLRLTAAQTGLVSGTTMYVAFLIIPLWSMLVDKFKVGKLIFLMSMTALMVKMLTISMAPGNICEVQHAKTINKTSYMKNDIHFVNATLDSGFPSVHGFASRELYDETVPDERPLVLAIDEMQYSHMNLFLFLMIVTVGGTVFSCPSLTLVDSATVELLVKNSEAHKYGKQRLWGSIGNGLAAFIVGASVSRTSLCPEGEKQVNYYLCFYVYAVFLFFAMIAGSRLQFNPELDSCPKGETSPLFASLRQVLANANYVIFLFTVFFDGVAMSFIKTFLFWFLKDLGGTQLLFSVVSAVNCSIEVFMYLVSSVLIKRMGSIRIVFIALLCYTVRFTFYAFVNEPWLVLIVEPLSGITTAALWSAIMSHVAVTARKESAVTLQGVIHCIHWGLGHGSGQVLGGLLVHSIGSRKTFAALAFTSIINFTLYLLVIRMSKSKRGKKPDQN